MIGWKRCQQYCGCIDEDACAKAPKNVKSCTCKGYTDDNHQCRCSEADRKPPRALEMAVQEFCRRCGANTPPRYGEGTCVACEPKRIEAGSWWV